MKEATISTASEFEKRQNFKIMLYSIELFFKKIDIEVYDDDFSFNAVVATSDGILCGMRACEFRAKMC